MYSKAKRIRPSAGSSSRPSWNSKNMLNARWMIPKCRKALVTIRYHSSVSGNELFVEAEIDLLLGEPPTRVEVLRVAGDHPHEHGDVDGDQDVGDEDRLAGAPVTRPDASVPVVPAWRTRRTGCRCRRGRGIRRTPGGRTGCTAVPPPDRGGGSRTCAPTGGGWGSPEGGGSDIDVRRARRCR